jgi:hypothetical protein
MGALWLGYWVDRYEPWALVISTACVAVGGGIFTQAILLGLAIILFGGLIPAVGLYWKRKGGALDDTAAGRERLLEGVLQPLLVRTASVVSMQKDEREREAKRAAEKVVDDLRWAFGTVPEVRTVVYGVSDDGQRMVPLFHAGRPSDPGNFVRGTPRGDKAFEVLRGKEPYISVRDLDTDRPAQWAGSGAGYRTFITAPIRSREDGFGLLTIDAPTAGTLDSRHARTLSLFAATLGVLFAEAARTTRDDG